MGALYLVLVGLTLGGRPAVAVEAEFSALTANAGLADPYASWSDGIAARQLGAMVAVLDPDTWSQSEILLSAELDSALTYDVVEATPDRLYVSANPSSGGFAYIVQVALDQGNAAKRVASASAFGSASMRCT